MKKIFKLITPVFLFLIIGTQRVLAQINVPDNIQIDGRPPQKDSLFDIIQNPWGIIVILVIIIIILTALLLSKNSNNN